MIQEIGKTCNFNPRSREGSDILAKVTFYFAFIFQSTLPRRERRFTSITIIFPLSISIHAPAKGATKLAIFFNQYTIYFNPRSREGSDSKYFKDNIFGKISIHAPAKGATSQTGLSKTQIIISIHAPAKGATSLNARLILRTKYFNPRSREGSDISQLEIKGLRIQFQSTLPRRERQRVVALF